MPPLPSAMRVPARARKTPFESTPVVENTYVPLRLPTVKPTWLVGGELLPPQPTRSARVERARNRTIALRTDIDPPWERIDRGASHLWFEVSTGFFFCIEPEPRE